MKPLDITATQLQDMMENRVLRERRRIVLLLRRLQTDTSPLSEPMLGDSQHPSAIERRAHHAEAIKFVADWINAGMHDAIQTPLPPVVVGGEDEYGDPVEIEREVEPEGSLPRADSLPPHRDYDDFEEGVALVRGNHHMAGVTGRLRKDS